MNNNFELINIKELYEDNELILLKTLFEESCIKILNTDVGIKDDNGDIIQFITVNSEIVK